MPNQPTKSTCHLTHHGLRISLVIAGLAWAAFAEEPAAQATWKVHDMARPQPIVVTPSGITAPVPAPSDAVVLFNGHDLTGWNGTAKLTEDQSLTIGGGDLTSKEVFGDCQLHVEWAAPQAGTGEGQNRGNSGVFLMGRYEVQVLDCYHNTTYPDGQTAALYGMHPPLANACLPPGTWQTYDIIWQAPRFAADGALQSPAYATVLHNGIAVQVHAEVYGSSTAGAAAPYRAHGDGPLRLQDHHNPVRYRNIWVRRLDLTSQPRPR